MNVLLNWVIVVSSHVLCSIFPPILSRGHDPHPSAHPFSLPPKDRRNFILWILFRSLLRPWVLLTPSHPPNTDVCLWVMDKCYLYFLFVINQYGILIWILTWLCHSLSTSRYLDQWNEYNINGWLKDTEYQTPLYTLSARLVLSRPF